MVRHMSMLRRALPLMLLLVTLAALLASGLAGQLNWGALGRHQATLQHWAAGHPVVAPLAFTLGYAVITALSVPEAALFTVAGGLVFGTWLAGTLVVIGAT